MRHSFLLFILLSLFNSVLGTTKIYVSTSFGDDNNSGLSENTPVNSISKALSLGDEIYLKAGDVFFEKLYLNKKRLGRYGKGANPTICGYKRILYPKWVKVGRNVWKTSLIDDIYIGFQTGSSLLNNVGCIHDYGNDLVHGRKVQYYNKLKEDWDFWQTEHHASGEYNEADFDSLYLYLHQDPNKLKLEFSVGAAAITMHESVVKQVNIMGWGFGISANSGCEISNCRIDAIGGMIQLGSLSYVCYGNGVEFYVAHNISNSIVEDCFISRCYDCACTIQGSRHEGATPKNIVFRNNLIVGCCYGWEDFLNNGEKTYYKNCRFENNILVYSPTGFNYPSKVVRYSHVVGNNTTGTLLQTHFTGKL